MATHGAEASVTEPASSHAPLTTGRLTVLALSAALPLFSVSNIRMPAAGGTPLSPTDIGIAYLLYFLVSAAFSAPGGRFVARFGTARSAGILCFVSAGSLGGLSLTTSAAQVIVLVAVAGLANALLQPTVSDQLVTTVQADRIPLLIGIIMAGVPVAALASGIAGQLLNSTSGAAALLVTVAILVTALGVISLVGERSVPHGAPIPVSGSLRRIPLAMVPVLLAAFLGSLGANSLPAFVALSASEYNLPGRTVAAALPIAVGLCVATRVSAGVWLSRSPHRLREVMALLLAIGTAGFLLMAIPAVFLFGMAFAYGGGWGWVGVANAYASIHYPEHAAVVTSWMQVGVFGGSALGPLAFGAIVTVSNPSLGWATMGVLACTGCLLLAFTRGRQNRARMTSSDAPLPSEV